jgi:hypothetical protein
MALALHVLTVWFSPLAFMSFGPILCLKMPSPTNADNSGPKLTTTMAVIYADGRSKACLDENRLKSS